MKRSRWGTWAGALLFLLAPFATPLHLAVEEHEFIHQEGDDHGHEHDRGHHRHGSDQGSHPAGDHELTAIAKAPRLDLATVELAVVDLGLEPPAAPIVLPRVDVDVPHPPDAVPTPLQSPRAPPV
jgi:hypothetical protein